MDSEPRRFECAEMLLMAVGAVRKIDRLGVRAITLCSMDEIAALACVAALSGLLPGSVAGKDVNETPMFRTRRNRT